MCRFILWISFYLIACGYFVFNDHDCISLSNSGYYRVAYEDALLDRLLYEITIGKSFDEYTMAQLITDLIEEALADVVVFSNAMDFLDRTFANTELHFGYWNAIFKAFEKLDSVFHNCKHYDKFLVLTDLLIYTV